VEVSAQEITKTHYCKAPGSRRRWIAPRPRPERARRAASAAEKAADAIEDEYREGLARATSLARS
jgi:hypothetical protein